MPRYKDETVSDAFVQGMLAAYRNAFNAIPDGGTGEANDEMLLGRLEETSVEQMGAAALGTQDAVARAAAEEGDE